MKGWRSKRYKIPRHVFLHRLDGAQNVYIVDESVFHEKNMQKVALFAQSDDHVKAHASYTPIS
jgi:hypothetical protein